MIQSQLYLHNSLRQVYISEIEFYTRIINERVLPVFANIKEDAEKFTEDLYNELGELPSDDDLDMLYVAEYARDEGIDYYLKLSLVKYEFTAISIASLYHIWEQQVRRFLFQQMRRTLRISLGEFCRAGMRDFKECFLHHQIDLEKLCCWPKLNEHQLICNVIKHGEGSSAELLYKLNPTLFNEFYRKHRDKLPIESTLLEENLNIDKELFNEYSENIIDFWRILPERAFSKS